MDPNANKHSLVNKLSSQEAKKKLESETFKRTTLSFYKYVKLNDIFYYRDYLYKEWDKLKILGRVYIATEGINAQISIPNYNIEKFREQLYDDRYLKNISLKEAVEEKEFSFFKLIIKIKKRIVADGLTEIDFDSSNVGNHLDADEWNNAIDKGAVIVDMRNHYESEIGHFKNAILPQSETFKQELPMVKKLLSENKNDKILLYCTGGIRCEKASAYLKHNGFRDVNQLHGGIINYKKQLMENPKLENKFIGKNFVFDERLSEKISDEVISFCHQCGSKCDTHINCKNMSCNLLFIQCKKCKEKFNSCCSTKCKKIIDLPENEQKNLRQGTINKKRFNSHRIII